MPSDPLTGLGTRRHFERVLEQALFTPHTPTTLLVLGIDHFEQIQGSCGTSVGEHLLSACGGILKSLENTNISAVYFGVAAFGAVLRNQSPEQALQTAEHIRAQVSELQIRDERSRSMLTDFSVSVGVATRRPGEPRERLLRRADAAYCKARNAGCNRVRCAA